MKILMLGWEYPPHIAGGLGMACQGLTKGLARLGIDITFVLPHLLGGESAEHMTLVDPDEGRKISASPVKDKPAEKISEVKIPALLKPYWTEEDFKQYVSKLNVKRGEGVDQALRQAGLDPNKKTKKAGKKSHYGKDLFDEITRFTTKVVSQMADEECDLIHAHDWVTYPAGVALARATGKPLIVHVHSLEYDRSGKSVNPKIYQIEAMGVHEADAVIAVSHYTKSVIHREYNVPLDKIHVVHNGIYPKKLIKHYRKKLEWPSKVVLFLGRITFQKGPAYFVRAAAKVIPHVPDVVFIMAGSGDMLPKIIDLACELGINQHFRFPGFIKGRELEEIFSAADLYVMPSVSEPFGLSALEAINFNTPAIISKQSGVAEVLDNALKFDFWDIDLLADLIVNSLQQEELSSSMLTKAQEELKKLRWDASAVSTQDVYRKLLIKMMGR